MSTTYSDLERRVTELNERMEYLQEADGTQRSALVRSLRVLADLLEGKGVAPRRMALTVAYIEEALGADGLGGQQLDHWNCKEATA